jgi:hypothetical protein
LQGPGLGAHLRRKQRRWAGTAEVGGGGRGCGDASEDEGGARQLVLVAALGKPREEIRGFGWR